ncbi:LysR substrate-binding domain-containing protein [Pseudomonas corrugata]|uniref:LysR substrate-binding domain-containing protein n=1 Tax=Pseudomonas corrugata TaxID=47879 RepID=UPI003709644C
MDFFNWFPAQVIAQLVAERPRANLEFELNDARVDLLGEDIDVALRGGDRDPSLFARKLGTGCQTLVASPGNLAAHGVPAQPGDLSSHHCVTSPSHGGAAHYLVVGRRRQSIGNRGSGWTLSGLYLLCLARRSTGQNGHSAAAPPHSVHPIDDGVHCSISGD